MLSKIIAYAKSKEIKLVAMNGSRVNKNILADPYQDYDVVFFVEDIEAYTYEPDVFGTVLISQENRIDASTRILMVQYEDGNRIDLQVRSIDSIATYLKEDSLVEVLYNDLDMEIAVDSSDAMYRLNNPSETEFKSHVNEMYWVSLYVLKALKRGQINYAKVLMTTIILEELSIMLGYNLNIKHGKPLNYGMDFKYLGHFLEEGSEYYYSLYEKHVSIDLILEVLDWYEVLVDNIALHYSYEKPLYHERVREYIRKSQDL